MGVARVNEEWARVCQSVVRGVVSASRLVVKQNSNNVEKSITRSHDGIM